MFSENWYETNVMIFLLVSLLCVFVFTTIYLHPTGGHKCGGWAEKVMRLKLLLLIITCLMAEITQILTMQSAAMKFVNVVGTIFF